MSNTRDIAVIVPARLHDHAVARIGETFTMIRAERADPALIKPRQAAAIRGVAAMTRISADFIDALPKLEIIANFGVGFDAVDAKHAALRGVMVTNTPDVLTEEVADTTIGLLINTVRELPLAEAYRYTSEVMVENMLEADAKEGIGAFIDKRDPKFDDR